MTEVLITKNIAGLRAGRVVELDDRLQKHVDAGNAKILPASLEDEQSEQQARPVALALAPEPEQDEPSYALTDDERAAFDDDEDTED